MNGPAQLICFDCGNAFGNAGAADHICTTQINTCAWCKRENITVTSATDFRLWAPPEVSK